MRRIGLLITILLCVMMLAVPVHATGTVSSVQNYATVAADGSCAVNLTVTLRLDTPASGLTFPLPAGSRDVTLNGSNVRTTKGSAGMVLADLSHLDGLSGQYSLSFQFTVSSVLETVEEKLVLELPLLTSCSYAVEALDFSVTFPGELTTEPAFTSGYLGSSVESIMTWEAKGNVISGSITQPLEDKESLTLTMNVTEEMFPGKLILPREGNPETVSMAICAGVAILYWLLMMRCVPIFRQKRATPPEGVTAGEVGSRLSSAGVDLTMMVFSWAAMGYIRIRPDKHGRVWLDKRMDMGNERTPFEVKVFRTLFARADSIDGTGTTYAKLCRKAALTVSGAHEMYRRKAGNIRIFRVICCGISLFCGICCAMNLTHNATGQVLLSVILAIAGIITAWGIQAGMYRFHIRGKTSQYISTVCMLLWILLGAVSGVILPCTVSVLAQMLAGLAAAYGGRRSSLGRLQASQILGLRHYLKNVSREELEQILDANPEYLFDMLPYAIALGVDTAFARNFGDLPMPQCAYLTARESSRTAAQWAKLLRKTADKLDKLQRQMQVDSWTLANIRRPQPARRPAQKRPVRNGERPRRTR